jgi:DNA-binding GntR family transcriptional regulator
MQDDNKMRALSTIQPITLRDQIVEKIRLAIIEGELEPNDHIVELELTEQLGVSRTPVREALILLESQGLVRFMPNRGCFVKAFDQQDVEEIFSMRITLENFAAELIYDRLAEPDFKQLEQLIDEQAKLMKRGQLKIARRVDMSFHQYLIEKSQHTILIKSWTQIVAQIAALLNTRAAALPEFDESTAIRDHQEIIAAYRSGDLLRVQAVNREINGRVAERCIVAINIA